MGIVSFSGRSVVAQFAWCVVFVPLLLVDRLGKGGSYTRIGCARTPPRYSERRPLLTEFPACVPLRPV
jgi:hypothetical protein